MEQLATDAGAPSARPPRRPGTSQWAPTDRHQLLERAGRAEATGDLLTAIEALTLANRLDHDPALDVRLVALRHHAYQGLDIDPPAPWPPALADPFPEVFGVPPEIPAADLDAATLGGGILHHGCLLVRGLLGQDDAARLADAVDAAHRARLRYIDSKGTAERDSWFDPFRDFDPPFGMGPYGEGQRNTDQPCLMAADSPRGVFEMLETIEHVGLIPIIEEYFGERAVLSIEKTTLRRTRQAWPTWHQDGSFIGADIRSVNCWMALGHCGGRSDTVGIDILPRRLDGLVPFNPDGEADKVPFVVPPERVAELAGDTPPMSPEFWAGDALLFDDLFLHTTGWPKEHHTGTRRAIEAWFFGASGYPSQYGPLVC